MLERYAYWADGPVLWRVPIAEDDIPEFENAESWTPATSAWSPDDTLLGRLLGGDAAVEQLTPEDAAAMYPTAVATNV